MANELLVSENNKKKYYPEIRKRYYEKIKNNLEFKEKSSEQSRKWRVNNKDKVNEKNRKWREKHKEAHLLRKKEAYDKRKKEDPVFVMHEKIRGLIRTSFKRGKASWRKSTKTKQILGCSTEEFIKMILDKAPKNTKLSDFHQFGYHLDHIIPVSTAVSEAEMLKLNHYSNFQPLWWEENLSKSNKIIN